MCASYNESSSRVTRMMPSNSTNGRILNETVQRCRSVIIQHIMRKACDAIIRQNWETDSSNASASTSSNLCRTRRRAVCNTRSHPAS